MKLYSYKAVDDLMDRYYEKGGQVAVIDEGCLAYGLVIMYGDGLKTAVCKEVYINPWSSGQSIRFYNECPKKYAEMIEKWENGEYDEDYESEAI